MPAKRAIERAAKDRRQGKSASTQAGEFVREEMRHMKQGKHSVGSPKQAIAIGLSNARRAGIAVPSTRSTRSRKASSSPRQHSR